VIYGAGGQNVLQLSGNGTSGTGIVFENHALGTGGVPFDSWAMGAEYYPIGDPDHQKVFGFLDLSATGVNRAPFMLSNMVTGEPMALVNQSGVFGWTDAGGGPNLYEGLGTGNPAITPTITAINPATGGASVFEADHYSGYQTIYNCCFSFGPAVYTGAPSSASTGSVGSDTQMRVVFNQLNTTGATAGNFLSYTYGKSWWQTPACVLGANNAMAAQNLTNFWIDSTQTTWTIHAVAVPPAGIYKFSVVCAGSLPTTLGLPPI
jgi:hypothetical protein